MSEATPYYQHGLRRMSGRRQDESHRAATPLELLFDLTFVAAFGVAGGELAHGIAEHAYAASIGAFAFAMVPIVWAWINYSWFASAFDTDDWLFRVLTMVQMAGVVILAIGLPPMFASIEHGAPVANEVMVAGYVVMRVALIAHWLRAAKGNPEYHRVAKTYVLFIGVAQLGWVLLIFQPLEPIAFACAALVASVIDWGGPVVAERNGVRDGGATPWHAHHIAERYSLLAIIALGETVLGTLSAAQAITQAEGWSFSNIMVVSLGVVMTFALWWVYFMVPSAPVLAVRRDKAFVWGYGHIVIFASIAAIGAGLHVIGYVYDDHYEVSTVAAISSIAVPVLVFMVSLYLIHGWPLWVCLLVVVLSPVVIVVFYELSSWRGLEARLGRALEVG